MYGLCDGLPWDIALWRSVPIAARSSPPSFLRPNTVPLSGETAHLPMDFGSHLLAVVNGAAVRVWGRVLSESLFLILLGLSRQ